MAKKWKDIPMKKRKWEDTPYWKRKWGYPVRFDGKTGRVAEINLYKYEQLELAKANVKACKKFNKEG